MSQSPLEQTPPKSEVGGDKERLPSAPFSSTGLETLRLPMIAEQPETSLRRSIRARVPSKRFLDTSRSDSDTDGEHQIKRTVEETEIQELSSKLSSATLSEECHDVAGRTMYGFRTPKKRDSMRKLAAQTSTQRRSKVQRTPTTPRTPAALRTPSSARQRRMKHRNPQTPAQVRQLRKQAIGKVLQKVDEESDASYSPASSSTDTEPPDTHSGSDDDEEEVAATAESKSIRKQQARSPTGAKPKVKIPVVGPTDTPIVKSSEYCYDNSYEQYFSIHATTKVVTSNHTLDLLATSRIPRALMQQLLQETSPPAPHRDRQQEMNDKCMLFFRDWLFTLNEGFSVLLFGIGHSANGELMQLFIDEKLNGYPTIFVQGYVPDFSIKDVLDRICGEVFEMWLSTTNTHEALDKIERKFADHPEKHLFLLVHNLDGSSLRNESTQSAICRLAAIDNVHFIASIENHIASAMWGTNKQAAYNFKWFDATTLQPYNAETSFENSLMVQNADAPAFDAMKRVVCSLTANARGIYNAIVKYQLTNQKVQQQHYAGMPMQELYRQCRESFLVSSDAALRCHLTEFVDHKLLRFKRNSESSEAVLIPLSHMLLQRFVDEQDVV
ncbi:origin recognition complex subunit 2-like [Anopheles darlingi]|uniref:origin recognition complex subunit 2-like n=1 Tax=Anopheles darlingi TaxID=43151 RepID=UPI0021004C70|nr:origin recognition complex subunit 2-like [Anopheles darlingi]